jgi:MOSC domain-containing protein YiiM
MSARVIQISRSSGGVPKLPIGEAKVTVSGLAGDSQRDRRYHGGPTRALSLYSLELIEALVAEGHPVAPGTLGENVTITGLDWTLMRPGSLGAIGPVRIEVTSFASPCRNIRGSFLDEEFTRISQKMHPGWSRVYARVLTEGLIRVGDAVMIEG